MEPQILSGRSIEVRDQEGHRSLRARVSFSRGDTILEVRGDVVAIPSRYSIQVDTNEHVEPGRVPEGLDGYDDYLWPFLNHGFDPNSMMEGKRLLAIVDIEAGAEVTFNYNANEWDMATPFECMVTGRSVTGNKHLSMEQRARIAPISSSFILELARQDTVPGSSSMRASK
jgi:hypothetical protein